MATLCRRAISPLCAAARQAQSTTVRGFAKKRWVGVVLLEDLTVKGFLGDEILVKPGFARNFLIPTKKAVYATPDNRQKYIITKTPEERTAMEEQRDFLIFKDLAAVRPVAFLRKVDRDNSTLLEPITMQDVQKAIKKQLKRTFDQSKIHMPGAGSIRRVGEILAQVEIEIPALQRVEGGPTTEKVDVRVIVKGDDKDANKISFTDQTPEELLAAA